MEFCGRLKKYTPHLVMTLNFLALAIFIVFLQSLISGGTVSSVVFVFYEHVVSTILLSTLALLFERGRRPPLTLKVFFWACLAGFLQIPLNQLLLTSSLGYISATFQTTGMNTGNAVTFIMAVIIGREAFPFCTINGQAKLWGIVLSLTGAIIMVLWSGPRLYILSSLHEVSGIGTRVIGCLMLIVSVLSGSSSSLLVEDITIKYPAEMSLSAIMCFCGTVQIAIIAGVTERSASAWKINFSGSSELPVILYGGIVVTGLSFYAQTWCIHKKGPVFTYAFTPLLIVFTFLLETFFVGKEVYLGSILGAIFVVVGLYMLLWAKAADGNEEKLRTSGGVSSVVFVFYEHLVSTFLLSTLAFFFERGKRPPITLKVFCWASLVGFLQIPMAQLLLTSSLGYISATFQSTAMNTVNAVTFIMAVIIGREALTLCTINGQAKLWGIILSLTGAIIMVLWSGPRIYILTSLPEVSDIGTWVTGCLMVTGSILSGSSAILLLEDVTFKYPAEMSLSAIMCFCGTLQSAIIAGLTERSVSAWKISFHDSYEFLVILYGGIVVTGFAYYAQTWCIHKKGPVFVSAFSPLLIVFTFLLETVILRKDGHLGSILGAVFVVVGLYVLLWGKADDNEEKLRTSSSLGTYEALC
ncbi:Wat1-related protein [Thalictrum thalictroides]|uniref:Wat1-related protein n=1 Tax=Thalictrum thalictroides TaxID=46969 RepID=A0A7J6X219_THATH|nr:Wat1-related protein [Thalictrum thalictroides]